MRLRENFTGNLERSREMPAWVGFGDLVELSNQALDAREPRLPPARAVDAARLAARAARGRPRFRYDLIDQTQNLLKAPQNETWDQRVDAGIRGLDVGAYVDADVRLGARVQLRGGFRADGLFYDVDDRLGNFIPLVQRQTHFLGFRRTAFGCRGGPRATLEVRLWRGLLGARRLRRRLSLAAGAQLDEGETAPFTKVRSAEVGIRGAARRA